MTAITLEPTLELPPEDEQPYTDVNGVQYPCKICGQEAGPYSGRGPKPKLCPDHKKGVSKGGSKRTGNNHVLATQAAAALAQINSVACVLLMTTGLPETASEIAERNDAFEATAYNALITDPDLCRQILKGGTASGKVSLLIAYAMLAAAVLPAARLELAEKKAAKLAAREAVE